MARSPSRTALALALCPMALIGCGGDEQPAPTAQDRARNVVSELDAPLDRLEDATEAARPSRRASIVRLRASADRAASSIRRARVDLRDIGDDAKPDERASIRASEDALDDLEQLASTLAASPLSVTDLEVDGERARQAIEDARLDLPEIDTTRLASAVQRSRRKPKAAQTQGSSGVSEPVGDDDGSSSSGESFSYETFYAARFQARLPVGGGWATPAESQPTPGRLYRTSVRGPGGLFVIVDYTPFETAKFGGSYTSRSEVGQTAFGSATRYVFTGGSLPECRRSECIDYIVNDRSTGEGFAVLAGGGPGAATIAQTVAESVTPNGGE